VEAASSSRGHNADDETVRNHTLTLLRLWAIRCHDNIVSIDQEVPLLREMERRRGNGGGLQAEASARGASPPRATKPWKPIVITREMLQVCVSVCVRERERIGYMPLTYSSGFFCKQFLLHLCELSVHMLCMQWSMWARQPLL